MRCQKMGGVAGALCRMSLLNTAHCKQRMFFVARAPWQMNTTCGDAVGWTALSVWETGERSGERESACMPRLDVHEAVIVTILQRVMDIIDPLVAPEPPKPRIGFAS